MGYTLLVIGKRQGGAASGAVRARRGRHALPVAGIRGPQLGVTINRAKSLPAPVGRV